MTAERLFLCQDCEKQTGGRRLDHALALFMIAYGAFVLHPAESMTATTYQLLIGWGSEIFWGFAILMLGLIQFAAIYINGGRGWTPYARIATNYAASITWVTVAIGIGAVDPWSTGVVNYIMLALAHVFCAVAAARDAAKRAIAYYGG